MIIVIGSTRVTKYFIGTWAVALIPLIVTPALADMASDVAVARQEAVLAAKANDMEVMQMHLHRGTNCLVSSDSGSYWPRSGTPCGATEGAISQTSLSLQKKRLSDAATRMMAGCNQSDIVEAHRYANEAIKLLDSAMATTE